MRELILRKPRDACNKRYQHAGRHPCQCGDQEGCSRPFPAAGLLMNGEAGGGARPVQQRKEHCAYCGQPRPSVGHKQLMEGGIAFKINDMPRRHIGHQNDGDHNFICGKPKDKGEEDDPVQPHQVGEWVKKMGAVHQEAHAPDLDVCGEPDDKPCRGRDGDGAPQHKKCAVKNRADNYLANLWAAVGRQL